MAPPEAPGSSSKTARARSSPRTRTSTWCSWWEGFHVRDFRAIPRTHNLADHRSSLVWILAVADARERGSRTAVLCLVENVLMDADVRNLVSALLNTAPREYVRRSGLAHLAPPLVLDLTPPPPPNTPLGHVWPTLMRTTLDPKHAPRHFSPCCAPRALGPLGLREPHIVWTRQTDSKFEALVGYPCPAPRWPATTTTSSSAPCASGTDSLCSSSRACSRHGAPWPDEDSWRIQPQLAGRSFSMSRTHWSRWGAFPRQLNPPHSDAKGRGL